MKRFFKYASKSDLIFLLVWSVIGIVAIVKNDIPIFNISMMWIVLFLFYIVKRIWPHAKPAPYPTNTISCVLFK